MPLDPVSRWFSHGKNLMISGTIHLSMIENPTFPPRGPGPTMTIRKLDDSISSPSSRRQEGFGFHQLCTSGWSCSSAKSCNRSSRLFLGFAGIGGLLCHRRLKIGSRAIRELSGDSRAFERSASKRAADGVRWARGGSARSKRRLMELPMMPCARFRIWHRPVRGAFKTILEG